jgi:hypothetical protein
MVVSFRKVTPKMLTVSVLLLAVLAGTQGSSSYLPFLDSPQLEAFGDGLSGRMIVNKLIELSETCNKQIEKIEAAYTNTEIALLDKYEAAKDDSEKEEIEVLMMQTLEAKEKQKASELKSCVTAEEDYLKGVTSEVLDFFTTLLRDLNRAAMFREAVKGYRQQVDEGLEGCLQLYEEQKGDLPPEAFSSEKMCRKNEITLFLKAMDSCIAQIGDLYEKARAALYIGILPVQIDPVDKDIGKAEDKIPDDPWIKEDWETTTAPPTDEGTVTTETSTTKASTTETSTTETPTTVEMSVTTETPTSAESSVTTDEMSTSTTDAETTTPTTPPETVPPSVTDVPKKEEEEEDKEPSGFNILEKLNELTDEELASLLNLEDLDEETESIILDELFEREVLHKGPGSRVKGTVRETDPPTSATEATTPATGESEEVTNTPAVTPSTEDSENEETTQPSTHAHTRPPTEGAAGRRPHHRPVDEHRYGHRHRRPNGRHHPHSETQNWPMEPEEIEADPVEEYTSHHVGPVIAFSILGFLSFAVVVGAVVVLVVVYRRRERMRRSEMLSDKQRLGMLKKVGYVNPTYRFHELREKRVDY